MNIQLNLRYVMLAGYFSLIALVCHSQSPEPGAASRSRSVSIGLTAGHYNYDPAVGIEVTSPKIFINNFRFRFRVNHTWFEEYELVAGHPVTFNSYWAGLVYNTRIIERGRIFLEAGPYMISPNQVFSSSKLHTGFYGSAGVELFVLPDENEKLSYFFSGGFAGIRAYADKIEGSPAYGNGFTFTTGLRYYF